MRAFYFNLRIHFLNSRILFLEARLEARRPQTQDGCSTLRPGNQAQLVRLHQARVRGHDADTKAVGAAFGCGNAALVNVISVAVSLAALI